MAIKIPRRNFLSYIIFLFVLLALILGITSIVGSIKEKNEKLYTDESKLNDWVYIDIVSIDPVSATEKLGKSATTSYEGFFCSCETADGKKFDAYIDTTDWNRYIKKPKYAWDTSSIMPSKVEFDTPLRVHGIVSNRKDILYASRDENLLLKIRKSDRPTE